MRVSREWIEKHGERPNMLQGDRLISKVTPVERREVGRITRSDAPGDLFVRDACVEKYTCRAQTRRNLSVCTFGKVGAKGRPYRIIQGTKNNRTPRRCPMPQPLLCLDTDMRHVAEQSRSVFSKPQEEDVVTVLLECEGKCMWSGTRSTGA
jgi:hypothetical protein